MRRYSKEFTSYRFFGYSQGVIAIYRCCSAKRPIPAWCHSQVGGRLC